MPTSRVHSRVSGAAKGQPGPAPVFRRPERRSGDRSSLIAAGTSSTSVISSRRNPLLHFTLALLGDTPGVLEERSGDLGGAVEFTTETVQQLLSFRLYVIAQYPHDSLE